MEETSRKSYIANISTIQTSYVKPSGPFNSSIQMPTSPIGDFFNDQDDMETDSDTRSLDTPAPVKFVRQDSVRMQHAAPIAAPSTAIIEKLHPTTHSNHHHFTTSSTLASPTTSQSKTQYIPRSPHSPGQPSPQHQHHPPPPPSSSSSSSSSSPSSSSSSSHKQYENAHRQQQQQQTAPQNPVEAMVQSGIKYHESGQLEKATDFFRQAATRDSPMGMFLYGVSLRHGWGCKKSEHLAFQYLQKAAEHAVLDLNSLSSTVNTSASKGELIISIYEMGISFRHGWGCKKNKETAVHFFKIAADLGDPDAQNDLGHCYHHGNGTKKDLHLAAKYYRKADKQGHGLMGNSWIWKPKYD